MSKSGYGSELSTLHAALTVAAALAILILSVLPPFSFNSSTPANYGLVPHIIAYGILCILTGIWLHVDGKTSNPALYAALLCSLFGLLIECVQYFVLYRSFEISDILINCCVAAVAIIPCRAILRYVPVYKKPTESKGLTSRLMR
jgi:VanZ family protein